MDGYTDYKNQIESIVINTTSEDIKRKCREIIDSPTSKKLYQELKSINNPKDMPGIPIYFVDTELARIMEESKRTSGYGNLRVFISGENGVGKSSFAKVIYNSAAGFKKSYNDFDCAGIPKDLASSELFGYKKGAFTGANQDKNGHLGSANGGTVFMDEIGDLPIDTQTKLLTVLSSKTFYSIGSTSPQKTDFRLISATNQNIRYLVQNGLFREDLFYRVVEREISIKPLRERSREELTFFIYHIFDTIIKESNRKLTDFNIDKNALEALLEKKWPGNNRQLISTLKTVCAMAVHRNATVQICRSDIEEYYVECNKKSNNLSLEDILLKCIEEKKCSIRELEKLFSYGIYKAVVEKEGNQKKAAKFLGMTESNLSKKLAGLD